MNSLNPVGFYLNFTFMFLNLGIFAYNFNISCRKSVTEMMCMKCLRVQPIGPTCSTVTCSNFPMARYYCRICKIFDDDR